MKKVESFEVPIKMILTVIMMKTAAKNMMRIVAKQVQEVPIKLFRP